MYTIDTMKDVIKKLTLTLAAAALMVVSVGVPYVEAKSCNSGLLTFPAWYSNVSNDCKSVNIDELNDIWVIVLNGIEILLQVVAYAATGYLVWAGIRYMKSRGDPSMIASAKSTIFNAVIGLGIGLSSVAIVRFISTKLSGGTTAFGIPEVSLSPATVATLMNTAVFPLAGVVCVIFIIIGGYQYTLSNGDSNAVTKAKNTILYAVVGLVVVMVSFGIVQLILGRFA